MLGYFKRAFLDDFDQMEAPSPTNSRRRKQKEQELLEKKDFEYNGIYEIVWVWLFFEKLVFWQCLLIGRTLIYNMVILPIRVIITQLFALCRIKNQ